MIPFVNIHTHNNNIDNKEFIEIQNIDIDDIVDADVSRLYSVGIHPWDVSRRDFESLSLQVLADLLSRCLGVLKAIGECGLDRTEDRGRRTKNGGQRTEDFEVQKEIFIKQIDLSEQYAKPMIIHAVRAYPDIIAIRKSTKAKRPWIIHGFQGNEQSAEQLLRYDGIYLSLGDVLYKNEERAKRLLAMIPRDRLFLETDVAERSIADVYEKASSLSGIETEEFRNDIFNNFVKIFGQI